MNSDSGILFFWGGGTLYVHGYLRNCFGCLMNIGAFSEWLRGFNTHPQHLTFCRGCACIGKTTMIQNRRIATVWIAFRLKFHLARLDSTRHIRRVEPMHFGCVELVEQHSSTRSTRRVRLARLARHVELDRRYLITVIHLLFNKLFTD